MISYAPARLGQGLPSRGTLFTIRRNGETSERIIVPPVNAVLTDVIGVGLASALFFSTNQTWIKILAGAGGLWMLGALAGKAYTFAKGSEGTAVIQ